MAAIWAAILFLFCMSFPDILYHTLYMHTKFEQHRTSGSKIMPDLRLYKKTRWSLSGRPSCFFTLYVNFFDYVSHFAQIYKI